MKSSLENASNLSDTGEEMALRFQRARKAWKLPSLLLFLTVFLSVCAAIFSHLESENDQALYQEYQKRKNLYVEKYNMSEEEFYQIMVDLTVMKKKEFYSSYRDDWGFYHSFWFVITVITTMGFGHTVPVTLGGRFFCIVCGLLGIPLNLLVLRNVGGRISKLITEVISKSERKWRRMDKNPKYRKVKCATVSFSLMVTFILIGGALDTIFDGWTFFDGVYFNFIALSTIGFGDLFPRVDSATKLNRLGDNGKRIFVSSLMLIYMIIGLSITSSVILSILNVFEEVSHIEVQWNRKGTVQSLESVFQLRKSKSTKSLDQQDKRAPNVVITSAALEDIHEHISNGGFDGKSDQYGTDQGMQTCF
ncbi:potassium channel subfamily K member 15-like [Actinia tenebrosa]|uniref:Potassium channel subfamily K member 15-like n=1 Tax=Actinia tenebrosa TaxID=6105 RepID=A0A6P8JCG1_ACTTE|nr:potassium channel subfamily K member 15-like [Actinia tenebrosa]